MMQHSAQNRARRVSTVFSRPLRLCLTLSTLAWGLAASAQTSTTTTSFTVGATVPDDGMSGLASVQTVSTPITNVTGLKVTLNLSGTWSGDLYCYLAHGAGRAVLLNRPGRTGAGELGYNDAGLDITFDDAAVNGDIHVYRLPLNGGQGTAIPGSLTGVWAPDARVASPASVLDTDERLASLSSFHGLDPNGEWVLFVADLETGDIHTLESWGLEITGETASGAPMQSLGENAGTLAENTTVTGSAAKAMEARIGAAAPALLTSLSARADGVRLMFTGSVGCTYQVERTAVLQGQGTVWTNIGEATTDKAGRGEFTDLHPLVGQGYYRAVGQ